MKVIVLVSALCLSVIGPSYAQNFIVDKPGSKGFTIASENTVTTILVDSNDHAVVRKVSQLFQQDVAAVTGLKPSIIHSPQKEKNIIIVGSIDKSPIIQQLISAKKLQVDSIRNRWEAYQLQVIDHPFDGIDRALVIAGSDRRGTAYGLLAISQQIGVSPWYYWADVPIKKTTNIYYSGALIRDAPLVKYRGIFINDEAPALSGWSKKTFGGFNHKFYEKVFELILRMKGNYLWPAMWGSAFNDDDTLNPVKADEYAIVMGTSHHEPLVRAHDEWRRYGKGMWNYDSNSTNLQAFWKKGIERMSGRENIVSIGMRGDGDEPMSRETATGLLERIVKDQREIIADVTRKPAASTPQLWALYKEVQDYYDKGMRVPDDVTLLLCDDNWGNIRKLPKRNDKPHAGGYGIYYHFDYVGGPRNYKWINTNQIERTWEQMHLAYEHGVDKIWIVNVGDIKPMELPTQFFLDYAWNPNKWTAKNLPGYYEQFAAEQFGAEHAKTIAEILAAYTRFNSRRKPELLSPETYSLEHYNEADNVVKAYNDLLAKAESINALIQPDYKAAYYQLVLHPVQASANLNDLYVSVAKNRYFAKQKSAAANAFADKAKQLYEKDSLITKYYNDTLAGGKWAHMMDQTHIGYTYWQQPVKNVMPSVEYVAASDTKTTTLDLLLTGEPADSSNSSALIPKNSKGNVFYEKNGVVSIEAAHFSRAVNSGIVSWQTIPNLGRTLAAITPLPTTAAVQIPAGKSARLEYDFYMRDTGAVKVHVYLSPTLNYHNEGLRFAISIDNEPPRIIDMHSDYNERTWNGWVANNIVIKSSDHKILKAGKHTLKYWMINPGVVLQKLVIDGGGMKPSYLGPPETLFQTNKN